MPKFVGVNISGSIVGHEIPYGGIVLPAFHLWCDGASYLRTAFPVLFAVIGTAHGAVDGTHFNVPDWRSRFMRGCDNMGIGAAGRDPGDGRSAMNVGGNAAGLGSVQVDSHVAHNHQIWGNVGGNPSAGNSFLQFVTQGVDTTHSIWPVPSPTYGSRDVGSLSPIQNTGGTENRPINGNTNFIIAYI
jgi:hypothetical protein